jgi:hypothetical protein
VTFNSQVKYPVKIMVANSLGGYTLVYMPALLVNYATGKMGIAC